MENPSKTFVYCVHQPSLLHLTQAWHLASLIALTTLIKHTQEATMTMHHMCNEKSVVRSKTPKGSFVRARRHLEPTPIRCVGGPWGAYEQQKTKRGDPRKSEIFPQNSLQQQRTASVGFNHKY